MNDTAVLDSRDEENLVRAIEFSLPIRRRSQFFLWSQGILQALIPHEMLFCAFGVPGQRKCITDKYTAKPFPEDDYREICSPEHGLLAKSHADWEESGHVPLMICPQRGHAWLVERFVSVLDRHALSNCAVHGMPPFNGGDGSFFCFAGMPGPLRPRHAYLLDILLPCLHVAYVRTLMNDAERVEKPLAREAAGVSLSPSQAVTGRQIQILQWLHEGKSNREIGEILSISPFTVKNHVQNILRKLNVKNRTQAVSFALSAHLINVRR